MALSKEVERKRLQKRDATVKARIRGKKKEFIQKFNDLAWNVTYACKAIGISRSTFYSWMKDEAFADAFNMAREEIKDYAETKLVEQVKAGNITAIIYYLKTQAKDRGYVEKSENDLNIRKVEVELTDE